jgi:hypothetical protein
VRQCGNALPLVMRVGLKCEDVGRGLEELPELRIVWAERDRATDWEGSARLVGWLRGGLNTGTCIEDQVAVTETGYGQR